MKQGPQIASSTAQSKKISNTTYLVHLSGQLHRTPQIHPRTHLLLIRQDENDDNETNDLNGLTLKSRVTTASYTFRNHLHVKSAAYAKFNEHHADRTLNHNQIHYQSQRNGVIQ